MYSFVRESNKIEGIMRDPTPQEIDAHHKLVELRTTPTVDDLVNFVQVIAPGHRLRNRIGLDVRVGNYYPPPGGENIKTELLNILTCSNSSTPYDTHLMYERLHPFTDGNGRSGRALWLWRMFRIGQSDPALRRGFLHSFYYQALNANDRSSS